MMNTGHVRSNRMCPAVTWALRAKEWVNIGVLRYRYSYINATSTFDVIVEFTITWTLRDVKSLFEMRLFFFFFFHCLKLKVYFLLFIFLNSCICVILNRGVEHCSVIEHTEPTTQNIQILYPSNSPSSSAFDVFVVYVGCKLSPARAAYRGVGHRSPQTPSAGFRGAYWWTM